MGRERTEVECKKLNKKTDSNAFSWKNLVYSLWLSPGVVFPLTNVLSRTS